MQQYTFEEDLRTRGLNLSDFAWACAKAVIEDQEHFMTWSAQQKAPVKRDDPSLRPTGIKKRAR